MTYYGISYKELIQDGESIYADYLELNASGDRGIDAMKDNVQEFAKIQSYSGKAKILVLDEAEGLTPAAKEILKSIVEKLAHNCIFIFLTNNIKKLTDAIFSRAAIINFDPIPLEEGLQWLEMHAAACDIKMATNIATVVYQYYKGDLRRIISDFLVVFTGHEVLEWKPRPTFSEEIFNAKTPSEKYLKLAAKEYIDPRALIDELFVLNKYKNVEIFGDALLMMKGDPMIPILYALTGLVKA